MAIPEECLPTRGYLAARLTYGRETTKACDVFHLMAGFVEIAAALGKQVWIESEGERLYLNLSICLLGRTGCGKSQVRRVSERILRRLEKVNIIAGTFSTEGLEKMLVQLAAPSGSAGEAASELAPGGGNPDRELMALPWAEDPERARLLARAHQGAALLMFDELSRLQEMGLKHFSADVPTTVASLLEIGGSVDRILVKERRRAEDLCVAGYALTQPVFFFEHLRRADLLRGPLTRFVYVLDEGRQPRYGYERGRGERSLNLLAKELHKATEIGGEIDVTGIQPETAAFERDLWERWSAMVSEEEAALVDARLFVRALQVAALYAVNDRGELIVRPEDWARSVRLLLHLREQILGMMRYHYAPTWELRRQKQILNLLRKGRGTEEREIMQRTGLTRRELDPILDGLEEAETIFRAGKGATGSPRQVWINRPPPPEDLPPGAGVPQAP